MELGYKEIEIRKSDFLAKTQFLCENFRFSKIKPCQNPYIEF